MATDPDDGEDEWRFSLEDLKDREDSKDAGSDVPEPPESVADEANSDNDGDGSGLDAGVAGRMEFQEELEAGDIDIENALFVALGVVLALAFLLGLLNLFP